MEKSRRLDLAFLAEDTFTNRSIWAAMAFQSGVINVTAFFISSRFVTHITGFATHFGADLATQNWKDALGMLTVPVFFLLGAMMSGFYIDREVDRGREAKYKEVFFIIMILIFFALMLSTLGIVPEDLGRLINFRQIVLISVLCMIAGMQNAAIATASKRVVRTTHLTGLTTDLGVGIIRSIHTGHQLEKKSNQIRLIILGSFIAGSAVGAFAFSAIGSYVFLIPFFITLRIYGYVRKKVYLAHKT